MALDLALEWDRPARTGSQPSAHTMRVRIARGPASGPFGAGLPVRAAIALDISGSMIGDKLSCAKQACKHVISLLRPMDRLSLAGFSTGLTPIVDDLPGGPQSAAIAARAMEPVRAEGVTRTDVALQWLDKALPPSPGAMRLGIVVTDGHPTDPLGGKGIDPRPLLDMAARMGRAGVTVCAVGLGSAASFNFSLLTQIGDRGRGAFLHAETASGLEQVLAARLSVSQTTAIADASLVIALLAPGAALRSACRFRPEYLPVEIEQDGALFRVGIGSVRSDTVTDALIDITAPAPGPDGWPIDGQEMVEVGLIGDGGASLANARAGLVDTPSYAHAQQRNADVEQDRLSWEVNRYSDALMQSAESAPDTLSPRRTGELLRAMEQSARRAGNDELADGVAEQIAYLRQTGRLDADRATGLLTVSRTLGAVAGERATGLLSAVSNSGEDMLQ